MAKRVTPLAHATTAPAHVLQGGRLPIKIETLFDPNVVEGDRVEFKAGWNPDATIRSICAFANDFQNFGGGYIAIGLEAQHGQPALPPVGVPTNQLDRIQKELLQYCNLIQPPYFPIFSVERLQNANVVVLYVPGGQNRPYKAPDRVTVRDKEYFYFIRRYSNSVKAKNEELKELMGLAANVPFDDRVCHAADVDDLQLPLIRSHLKEIGSSLRGPAATMPLVELGRRMAIVEGADDYLKPRNVGLMFFNDDPERWFPGARINVVHFPQGASGKTVEEKSFRGPLQQQIRDALAHLRNTVILDRTIKITGQAEASQTSSYPFEAIEEALVNGVYHRSYEERHPVEVQIHPDRVAILSYPGPDRSIRLADLNAGRIVARRYRNRRIGDFLKELKLTEGLGTGIPTIKDAMRRNGSPPPRFKTDRQRSYFLTELLLRPGFTGLQTEAHDQAHDQAHESLSPTELRILEFLVTAPRSVPEIVQFLGYRSLVGSVKSALLRLDRLQAIALTIPEKPRSKRQKRRLTSRGRSLIDGTKNT